MTYWRVTHSSRSCFRHWIKLRGSTVLIQRAASLAEMQTSTINGLLMFHCSHFILNVRSMQCVVHLWLWSLVILPICRRSLAKEFQSCIFYVAKKPIENVKSFLHLGHSFTSEFNDDEDINNGRSNFVSHTNNYLCYFRKLHPFVQYILFQANCTNLYGCELWLTNCNIEALCVAWRKTA